MKEIVFEKPAWQILRQTLSLSLLKCEPVRIKAGAEFIRSSFDLIPLFDDLKDAVSAVGAGFLDYDSGDVVYLPESPGFGTFNIDSGKYSSVSEIQLFLMPALFSNQFRSVINYTGVTHSHISYPTTFIKETLLAFLEKTGHYGSMNLKRFGFYGSGGGVAESRIYPAEVKCCGDIFSFSDRAVEGVKIFVSRMSKEMAAREKDFILKNLDVDEQRITIMEILDSDGYGNSIQIYFRCGDIFFIMSRDMEMYNSAGDFVFDENISYRALSALADECRRFLSGSYFPEQTAREVIPYLFMSGSNVPPEFSGWEITRICSLFF